jgi:hypothetical protein
MNNEDFKKAELILDLREYMCKTPKTKDETRMLKLYAVQVTHFASYCAGRIDRQNSFFEDIEKLEEELKNANTRINKIKQLMIQEKKKSEYKYYREGLIEISEFCQKHIADAYKSYDSED